MESNGVHHFGWKSLGVLTTTIPTNVVDSKHIQSYGLGGGWLCVCVYVCILVLLYVCMCMCVYSTTIYIFLKKVMKLRGCGGYEDRAEGKGLK